MPFDQQEFELLRSFAAPGDAASTSPANVVDSDPVLRVLTKARDLVAQGWCKGVLADYGGVCILGGVGMTAEGPEAVRDTVDLLIQHLPPYFAAKCSLPKFNDCPTTTHADVLALFDRAIASRSPAIQGGEGVR